MFSVRSFLQRESTLNGEEVQIHRLAASSFKAKSDAKFIDVWKLSDLYSKLYAQPNPQNLILEGPKGVAKSLSIQSFAAERGIPLVTVEGSEDIRRSHLIGMFIMRGDETPFILGDITTAIEVANEAGECILNFEEINAISPQMQKIINPLTDFRKRVSVPECGRVFELRPGAKLWVTGTMNSVVYGGVYAMNEDLKSRFLIKPMRYPTEKEEGVIVMGACSYKPSPDLVAKVLRLAQETRQKVFAYAMSTRDVMQVVEVASVVGPEDALRLVSGKFDAADRATFTARVTSVFGFKL
jgi:nitric oxide reductase NorQ protein